MLNILTDDILKALEIDPDSDLVITVGNSFRSDDGAGPYIAKQLADIKELNLIDAGYTPENIVEEVVALSPLRIIIIDAADFKATAGTVRIISEDQIGQTTLSTHAIPMNVITNIICDTIKTTICFIGIQVKNVALGEEMSPEVKRAADAIAAQIKKAFAK